MASPDSRDELLRRSHSQLQTALAAGLIATWYWELNRDLIYVDANLAALFAVPAHQGAAGLTLEVFLEAIHPQDRERVQERITDSLLSGKPYESEYRVMDAAGTTRWVMARGQIQRDARGNPVSFPGVLIDITDRKLAEARFAESEERLVMAVEAAQLSTWDFYPQSGELVWSDRCKALFGLPPDAAISYGTFLEGLHPDDRAATDAAVRQTLLADQGMFRAEFRLVPFDGGPIRWVRSTGRVFFDDAGQAHRFVGTLLDITESKQTEAELTRRVAEQTAEAELTLQQLRTTLDASLNSIIAMTAVRDEAGQIIDFRMDMANAAVLQSALQAPEQIIGRNLLEVFPGNRANGFFDLYVRVIETGQSEQSVQYYRDETGLEGWFEVSAVRQGESSLVVTYMNITERKLQERNLEESLRQLEEFAFVASHDLQEPLRKIQQFTDRILLKHATSFDGPTQELFNRLRKAAGRMQLLVNDLLTYSRLTPRDPIPMAPVDLRALLDEVLDDLSAPIRETGARVEIQQLPTVHGNASQLQQLFQNLLSNALKFTPKDRTPRVLVRGEVLHRSELPQARPAQKNERWLQLSVTDNGIGFEDQYREKIFQAFQRLHRREDYEGTGIGLAICQRVAERHGGFITAQSQPGTGSTFAFYLPLP
jgi:PAS domain S-box-containing protein